MIYIKDEFQRDDVHDNNSCSTKSLHFRIYNFRAVKHNENGTEPKENLSLNKMRQVINRKYH